jgi:hypothetical protein
MPKKFSIKTHHGKYLCAEPNHVVVGNRDALGPWEQFEVIKLGDGKVFLRSHHGKYLVRLIYTPTPSVSVSFIPMAWVKVSFTNFEKV